MVRALAILVAAVLVLVAAPSEGRKKKTFSDDGQLKVAPAKGPVVHEDDSSKERPYSGVTLSGGAPPEMKLPPSGLTAITWTGFRAARKGEGSEVFIQLTGPVTYTTKAKGHHLLITMEKAIVPLRNNLRPVLTHNFPRTPVSSFRLRPLSGDRVQLTISLRRKAQPNITVSKQGQYSFLLVAFPPVAAR